MLQNISTLSHLMIFWRLSEELVGITHTPYIHACLLQYLGEFGLQCPNVDFYQRQP